MRVRWKVTSFRQHIKCHALLKSTVCFSSRRGMSSQRPQEESAGSLQEQHDDGTDAESEQDV